MLPSGQHVAIRLLPLNDLLANALNIVKVHKVLAIQSKEDLYPYAEIFWLIPEGEATAAEIETSFLDSSLPRPPGLVPVLSGLRLGQFKEFAKEWDQADKDAFWEFIRGRAQPVFDEGLAKTREIQQILRTQAEGYTKLMVMWWDAGVHPAQGGYQVEEWDTPVWDTYDMLAAMGQVRALLGEIDKEGAQLDDLMRLNAWWTVYGHAVPQLAGWPDAGIHPREEARRARDGKWLDAMDAQRRTALHRRCVQECVALWDHWGEKFPLIFPDAAKIIDLVVVSPDANEVFDQ
jgi:hypothetical protein